MFPGPLTHSLPALAGLSACLRCPALRRLPFCLALFLGIGGIGNSGCLASCFPQSAPEELVNYIGFELSGEYRAWEPKAQQWHLPSGKDAEKWPTKECSVQRSAPLDGEFVKCHQLLSRLRWLQPARSCPLALLRYVASAYGIGRHTHVYACARRLIYGHTVLDESNLGCLMHQTCSAKHLINCELLQVGNTPACTGSRTVKRVQHWLPEHLSFADQAVPMVITERGRNC